MLNMKSIESNNLPADHVGNQLLLKLDPSLKTVTEALVSYLSGSKIFVKEQVKKSNLEWTFPMRCGWLSLLYTR